MGIDIYLSWEDQTAEEANSQYTGFDVTKGNVGYLREAYHGGPYATHVLVPEAFDAAECVAQIPAKLLKERLPEAVATSKARSRAIYGDNGVETAQAFIDFCDLAASMEQQTGQPCTVTASY